MTPQDKQEHPENIHIVGIVGSLRENSFTKMAVKVALEGAQEAGAQTHLIELKDYQLAFCDGRKNRHTYPSDVKVLTDKVKKAQGIILGTPEYHGGYSGALKNALDLMGFEEFEGKMLGLVGVSGGEMGAVGALNGLRDIGRALHAWVLPFQASIPASYKMFDPEGKLLQPELEERVKEVGRQVARFTFLHTSDRIQKFLQLWEKAPENPGGKI